ncbi:ABC transporter permease [Dyella sp. A6]|uniref:ABC transporter permease n=1 Tax=Dyella aluminiiresistens TaxID=3069105 RepID=UPI002E797D80|nr:ABC transporter permease [Dyella sp. A6]
MNIWLAEIWLAWRASLRRPGFLLLAAGVLALGIGATTTVFALIQGTLMKPLPYPQAGRLVALGMPEDNGAVTTSPQMYQHLLGLDGVRSIGIGASLAPSNVYVQGQPVQVPTMLADRHLLPTLGVHLFLGRDFTADEDRPHGPSAVILGYAFWQRFCGGRKDVVGRTLVVEGTPHIIVGVLPAGFDLFGKIDIMLPMALSPGTTDDGTNDLTVARLAPGVSLASVSSQIDARLRTMESSNAYSASQHAFWRHVHFRAVTLRQQRHADEHGVMMLFLGCALLVLLIALVNVGNLMLLRTLARGHDGAVRRALGASALHQALPVLAEALLMGLCAGLAGIVLASLGLKMLRVFVAGNLVDLSVVAFGPGTMALAVVAAVVVALLAAGMGVWRSRHLADPERLREGGRTDRRLGRVLVVTQVVLATMMLSVTGLFLHALYQAAHTRLGFSDRGILTFELAPVKAIYPDAASIQRLSQQVLEPLRNLPGVDAAIASTNLPVGMQFNIGDVVSSRGEQPQNVQFRAITPGFFTLFHIRIHAGRVFTREDARGSEPVAIVNRELARHDYGGDALGKTITIGSGGHRLPLRIVGVVDNTSQFGALWPQPPILYLPLTQTPTQLLDVFRYFEPMRFAIRVHGDPATYRDAVRRVVARVAPMQPIANLRTLTSVVASQTADTRQDLLLIGVLAAMALLLATTGLYAVMAVSVAARECEIGVRMALGAAPPRLLRRILLDGAWQVLIGLMIGIGLTLGLARFARELMFDALGRTNAFEPWALAGVVALLLLAGLLACLVPALRASRVAPMRALRGD